MNKKIITNCIVLASSVFLGCSAGKKAMTAAHPVASKFIFSESGRKETFEIEKKSKNILFAHGMSDDSKSWATFANDKMLEKEDYNVFMTDVAPCGSVKERARDLADYIIRNDALIDDNTLIAVGHSMGGLDLRYIIGRANEEGTDEDIAIFKAAASKVKKVYTIATPHGGVAYAALNMINFCTPAVNDLKNEAMDNFNKRFKYADFKNPATKRQIPFMAFHFQCPTCSGATDCVVGTNGQTWKDAPQEKGASRTGKHVSSTVYGAFCKWELAQTDVLKVIVDQNK